MPNYIKVTRYSPRPSGGRRAIAEEKYFFFNDLDTKATEHARFKARAVFERWDAFSDETGCKVVASMFLPDEKCAGLRDWIRPIAVHECERATCGNAAIRGPYCAQHQIGRTLGGNASVHSEHRP